MTPRPDPRPLGRRLLVWSGIALLLLLGPALLLGSGGVEESQRGLMVCFGLFLLVSAAGGVAREVAEHRIRRRPGAPRLVTLPDGERAVFLPRAAAPTLIASLVLLGYAVTLVVGAVLASLAGHWILVGLLLSAAGWLVWIAAPHRVADLAGGVWLTPTRVVSDYRGWRWEARWDDIDGDDGDPLHAFVFLRPGVEPSVRRTGPRGSGYKPVKGSTLVVDDAAHLAGHSPLVRAFVRVCLHDHERRAALGTPDSLPVS